MSQWTVTKWSIHEPKISADIDRRHKRDPGEPQYDAVVIVNGDCYGSAHYTLEEAEEWCEAQFAKHDPERDK